MDGWSLLPMVSAVVVMASVSVALFVLLFSYLWLTDGPIFATPHDD